MLCGQHVEGRHGTVSQRRAGQQREAAAQFSGRQLQAAKIHALSHCTAQAARHHRYPHPRPARAAQRLRQRAVCQNHPFVYLRQRRVPDQQRRGLYHRAHQTLAAPHLPETAQRARQGAGLPPGGSGAVSGGSMGMEGRRQEVFPPARRTQTPRRSFARPSTARSWRPSSAPSLRALARTGGGSALRRWAQAIRPPRRRPRPSPTRWWNANTCPSVRLEGARPSAADATGRLWPPWTGCAN